MSERQPRDLIYIPISMPVNSKRKKENEGKNGRFFLCQETKAERSLTDVLPNAELSRVWVIHMSTNISFFSS